MTSGLLKGKRLLVTGGAMGIGKAIAMTAAREKAYVIIADIDPEAGKNTARAIQDQYGNATYLHLDVTHYETVEKAKQKLKNEDMLPQILVNNAALWTIAPFVQTRPEQWRSELEVTLFGVLNCSRVFLPTMLDRGYGVIINIASDAGRVGEPLWAVYSAAKGAIIAFTKALAKEVAKNGIRVNAVSPGLTMTEKVSVFLSDKIPRITKHYPMGRPGKPEEVAEAVVFLASDRASFITGQVLSVSGGYSMVG